MFVKLTTPGGLSLPVITLPGWRRGGGGRLPGAHLPPPPKPAHPEGCNSARSATSPNARLSSALYPGRGGGGTQPKVGYQLMKKEIAVNLHGSSYHSQLFRGGE